MSLWFLSDDEKNRIMDDWTHPMRKPFVEKVVVNCCLGKGGELLEKAKTMLQRLTGQAPTLKAALRSVRDFNIRKGENIATVVTIRDQEKIRQFLQAVLAVHDNQMKYKSFDRYGNVSFGIKEHIDIPGQKYDPDLGIFGMDVCISIRRPGMRVIIRKKNPRHISKHHYVDRGESILFMLNEYRVEIVQDYQKKYY